MTRPNGWPRSSGTSSPRYTPVAPGREQHEPGPELWREYTDQVTQLRDQLSAVDPTDRATWARVARETSGAFAAWSQRVEATPGPLADASRTLARTAQIRARDVRPKNTAGPRSIAGAANLLAMATTHGQGTQAEAMLFRQLMRTAQAIYSMHQAVDESRRAAEIRNALGSRLDAVRARMPELVGVDSSAVAAESPMTETLRQATGGQAPARPAGSPLPTPLAPRPQVPTTPPERGAESRIRQELRERYDVEVLETGADPAVVRATLVDRDTERAEHDERQAQARDDQDLAASLVGGAEVLEVSADLADAEEAHDLRDLEHDAELSWDSAERRELHVEGIKAGPDQAAAATAWKQADVDQARHPREAVKGGRPKSSRAKTPTVSPGRQVERGGR